jgi:TetR/AcrR family transcriptional repressor of bet genes
MARPSNATKRRQQIVNGLLHVMASAGYEGATIPAVAAQAGLTSGLVHYYFKSKQEILLALIQNLFDGVQLRFSSLTRGGHPRQELRAFIDAHVALGDDADSNAVSCWISIGAEAVRQPEIRQAFQRVAKEQIAWLEDIVERILEQEKRTRLNKRGIALGILSAIEGAYRLVISSPELIEPGFAAPMLMHMADGAIAAQSRKT